MRRRRAFSLIEAVAAVALVGILLVAVMQSVGASRVAQYKASGRRQGSLLGQELMAEILAQHYQDPEAGPSPLGRDSGEPSSSRLKYDDVDDYDGWFSKPPQAKDGTPMTSLAEWSRGVEVDWVNPGNPGSVTSTESGCKLITVTVKHNDTPMARLTAIRSSAAPEAGQ